MFLKVSIEEQFKRSLTSSRMSGFRQGSSPRAVLIGSGVMDRRRSMPPGLLVWFFGGKGENKKSEPCRRRLMVIDVPGQDETPLFISPCRSYLA